MKDEQQSARQWGGRIKFWARLTVSEFGAHLACARNTLECDKLGDREGDDVVTGIA